MAEPIYFRDRKVFAALMKEFLSAPPLSPYGQRGVSHLTAALEHFEEATALLESQELQFPEPYETDYRE